MQELVGRLTSLDAEASETLKVITYFDQLIEGRVGVETMVRGAALLSGVVAGLTRAGRTTRIDPSGTRLPSSDEPEALEGQTESGPPAPWPGRACGPEMAVWLERTGPAHANDAMVLERLAHALMVTTAQPNEETARRQSLEALLDASTLQADRDRAMARLGIDLRSRVTVLAVDGTLPTSSSRRPLASARMATAYGLVTAYLVRGDQPVIGEGATRVGAGTAVTVEHLPRSWSEAMLALRTTTDGERCVRIQDLGLLAHAIDAADLASSPSPDVDGLNRAMANGWTIQALEALAAAESVRAVARTAGLHHSTMQTRMAALPALLGFDPVSGRGRARLHAALIVSRSATARFGTRTP